MARDDVHLSHEAQELVGFTYERSRELHSILNEKSPLKE
jgi:hypothetical protein